MGADAPQAGRGSARVAAKGRAARNAGRVRKSRMNMGWGNAARTWWGGGPGRARRTWSSTARRTSPERDAGGRENCVPASESTAARFLGLRPFGAGAGSAAPAGVRRIQSRGFGSLRERLPTSFRRRGRDGLVMPSPRFRCPLPQEFFHPHAIQPHTLSLDWRLRGNPGRAGRGVPCDSRIPWTSVGGDHGDGPAADPAAFLSGNFSGWPSCGLLAASRDSAPGSGGRVHVSQPALAGVARRIDPAAGAHAWGAVGRQPAVEPGWNAPRVYAG